MQFCFFFQKKAVCKRTTGPPLDILQIKYSHTDKDIFGNGIEHAEIDPSHPEKKSALRCSTKRQLYRICGLYARRVSKLFLSALRDDLQASDAHARVQNSDYRGPRHTVLKRERTGHHRSIVLCGGYLGDCTVLISS